ncbi:MAG: nucleotidyltransferase family protein, partial [Alphaproteobacteria bacterium]
MHRDVAVAQPESRLLCLCAGALAGNEDRDAIRRVLEDGIDWTVFARQVAVHDLAGLAGYALARAAPAMAPRDILDALRLDAEQTSRRNRALLDDLVRVAEALAEIGIETIAFKAPVRDIRSYCELGLRRSGDPALLLHAADTPRAVAALGDIGYRRRQLPPARLDLIRRLQGYEVLTRAGAMAGIRLHTRAAPMRAAFDIDHPALWRRARPTPLQGRTLTTLAPEDELLLLAAQYGEAPTWSLGWACDVAGFIGAHPELDWHALAARARAQGMLPMLLVATELARTCFNADIPEASEAARRDTPIVQRIARRIVADWRADRPSGPARRRTWLEPALLRDGGGKRARYIAGALFLPDARHIARMPLPDRFAGLPPYIALKLAHDVALLPLVRGWRGFRARVGRARDRLASHEKALALLPISADERRLWKRRQATHAAARRAVAAEPNDLTAWTGLGDALFELKRHAEAIACYEKVLASAPGNRSVWLKRARAHAAGGGAAGRGDAGGERMPEPGDANGWAQRAGFLVAAGRFAEAAAASDRALAINPADAVARRIGIGARISCCDWRQRDADKSWVSASLRAGRHALTPFTHEAISDSAAENLLAARIWADGIARPALPLWNGDQYRHERIRVAYLSAEFRDHPIAILIAGVLEHHDRGRFEVTAVSLGPNSTAKLRQRIEAACERVIDVQDLSDAEAAAALRRLEIDIAIDLNGYAGAARPGILAHRPAPVQVSYLGTFGTTGASFLDYIIADRTVLPRAHFPHYTEQVVYLPHSYLPNDS